MKKTLVALAVTAFAVSSASALTVFNQDGTKVDFNGSIRLLLEKNSSKTDGVTSKRAHSNLHNDGSRFGVTVKQDLAEDFYALGRLEFRFNGTSTKLDKDGNVVANNTTDSFGSLYAHRAYVGLGSKKFGELTFGRQVTIGDDIAQSDFSNQYDTWSSALTTSGKSVVRYDYKGIDGLQVGVDYRFAEEREKGEVKDGALKSGYGVGAVYSFDVAEGQSATVAAGYTRDNYKTTTSQKHHKDAWTVGAKYTINALTLGADYTGSFDKDGDSKDRLNAFRVGAKYQVTDAIGVYGNYGHGVGKDKTGSKTDSKTKHQYYLLGTDYKLHKNVFTYVEGGVYKKKVTDYSDNSVSKTTEKNVGVGLRVHW